MCVCVWGGGGGIIIVSPVLVTAGGAVGRSCTFSISKIITLDMSPCVSPVLGTTVGDGRAVGRSCTFSISKITPLQCSNLTLYLNNN